MQRVGGTQRYWLRLCRGRYVEVKDAIASHGWCPRDLLMRPGLFVVDFVNPILHWRLESEMCAVCWS